MQPLMRPLCTTPRLMPLVAALLLLALTLAGCATSRYGRTYGGTRPPTFPGSEQGAVEAGAYTGFSRPPQAPTGYVKDNRPSIWLSTHPRVQRFYDYYESTITVEHALQRAQPYLPTIIRVFRARRLPLELAFLPMLESVFKNDADSGSARGLWQFTEQTAEEMGLAVGAFVDERMNWAKATVAAADYLDRLGERFNYNWGLALAAYNGGPGYVEQAMRSQHSWNFFDLRLRQETYDYVPRFVAMVQVAKEKFPHLLVANR